MLIGFAIFIGLVIALGVASVAFGADSRDGQDWMCHRSAHTH